MFVTISKNNLTFEKILHAKLDIPYNGTHFNHTPIFEWSVVQCGSKYGYQKATCLKEIELCAQNMIIMGRSIKLFVK